MKRNFIGASLMSLVLAAACFMGGCATSGVKLPQPTTPKQAGVTALVAYGLAGSYADTYVHYPYCTSPLTVVPCKTAAIETKVKAANKAAYDAAIAADAAANDVGKQQEAADKLKALNDQNAEAKKESQ